MLSLVGRLFVWFSIEIVEIVTRLEVLCLPKGVRANK